MKTFLFTLLFAAVTILGSAEKTFAQASARAVVLNYSTTNIPITNWVTLISQTTRAIHGISVYNTGASAMQIGITGAGNTTNSETQVLVVPASMSAPLVLPVSFSGGYRISLLAYSTVTTGIGQFNFMY